jgi:hypothetical protein
VVNVVARLLRLIAVKLGIIAGQQSTIQRSGEIRRFGFRVLTSSGVNVGGHRFHSTATYQLLNRLPRGCGDGVRVRCAWYPDDCTFILVWDPLLKKFVSLPNVDMSCSKGLSWKAAELIHCAANSRSTATNGLLACGGARAMVPSVIGRRKAQTESTLV